MSATTKSAGHLLFWRDDASRTTYEYFEAGAGICKAPVSNVLDLMTGARAGRWECPMRQWSSLRKVLEAHEAKGWGRILRDKPAALGQEEKL